MKKVIGTLLLGISLLQATPLKDVTLDNENGGYIDGKVWSSKVLEGKTTMLMYVDPDERGKGEIFKSIIEGLEQDMDFNKFQIMVVLNLKATWKPNMIIMKLLKDKAKDYPQRIYVVDKDSVLVNAWDFKDDEYNVSVIDKNKNLIYSHSGDWNELEMNNINKVIRSEVKK